VSRSAVRSAPTRPRVLIDANALFLVIRTRFPLEEEVERNRPGSLLGVPSSVLGELDGLAEDGTPGAAAARALADRFERVRTSVRGDGGVLDAARRTHAWVVTADRELQRRLIDHGITVLRPRDRHRLEAVEGRPAPLPRRPRGNS
jgi:rRNA-processing protein FCF1